MKLGILITLASVLTLAAASPARADSNAVERHWRQVQQSRNEVPAARATGAESDASVDAKPDMANCSCCAGAQHHHPRGE